MTIAARVIAVCICIVGVIGLAVPDLLLRTVETFEIPTVVYVTALLRIVAGVVFVRAAPESRAASALRALGYFVIVAGLATPFVGAWGARLVLEWWTAGGPWIVRAVAGVALALGLLLAYVVTPPRRLV